MPLQRYLGVSVKFICIQVAHSNVYCTTFGELIRKLNHAHGKPIKDSNLLLGKPIVKEICCWNSCAVKSVRMTDIDTWADSAIDADAGSKTGGHCVAYTHRNMSQALLSTIMINPKK